MAGVSTKRLLPGKTLGSLATNFIQLSSEEIVTQYVNATLLLVGRSAEPLGKAWWGILFPTWRVARRWGGHIACLQLLPLGLTRGEPDSFQHHSTCHGAWPQGTVRAGWTECGQKLPVGSDKGFSHRPGSENLGLLFPGRPICPQPLSCCILVGELSDVARLRPLTWKRHIITIILARYDCIPGTRFQLVVSVFLEVGSILSRALHTLTMGMYTWC